jgi:hypothetical protein
MPRIPKSLKPILARHDKIFALSESEHCVSLTERQNELIAAMIDPMRWLTRWSFGGELNPDPDAIEAMIDDLQLRLSNGLSGESGCGETADCATCQDFYIESLPDWIEWRPHYPGQSVTLPGSLPYLGNVWRIAPFDLEIFGVKQGDVYVDPANFPPPPISLASFILDGFPRFTFYVQNASQVELEFISLVQGGAAIVAIDGVLAEIVDLQSASVIDITSWIDALEDVIGQLQYNQTNIANETVIEINFNDTLEHRITVTFIPKISLDFGIGGGIRRITVCGENAMIIQKPQLRPTEDGCGIEWRPSDTDAWEVLIEDICGADGEKGDKGDKGDTGADGECPDCADTPPITEEDKLAPDYLERVCGGALLLADATIDGYKAALQEAIDGVNGGNIPLSAYQMAQGALAAVVLSSAVSGQWYATAGAAAGMIALKAYYDDAPSVPELQQYQADIEAIRETAKEVLYCQIAANGEFTQNLYYLWLAGLSIAINQSVPFELVGGNLIQWDLAIEIYYKGWLENPSTACAGYCQVEVEADFCKYFDLTTQVARDAFTLTTGTKLSTGFRATQSGVNEYWEVEAELDQAWIGELMQFDLELDIIADAPTTPDYIQGVYNGIFLDAPYPYEDPVSYKTNDNTPLASSTTNKQFRFKLAYRDGLPFGEENPISNRFLVTGVRIKFNAASDPWPTIPNCP